MAVLAPGTSLLGRERELALAVEVCRGTGEALVVMGEPGIGKTSLLTAAAYAVPDRLVLRATGVEAEATVAFATLQGLLWPLRDNVDELAGNQAALLRGILDVGPSGEASEFAVGAAALTLLSLSACERPIVVVIDDAQWADVPSQQVACFVGRRLEHEPIAMLAGVREGHACLLADERSFARLELGPLDADSSRNLLDRSGQALAPGVATRLLEVCAGNPLGLIELPQLLTEAQRRGKEPLPPAFGAGPLVQRAFAEHVSCLAPDARRGLLILAAAGEADPVLLQRVGVSLVELEESGLGGIDYRHPLLQSAAYGAASPAERRTAHRVLADALSGQRRAWHLAEATAAPDESVAALLEQAADEAGRSGGAAAQGQALERAADLTPDDERRARRLLAGAQSWVRGGDADRAQALLDQALPLAATPRARAEIQLERGNALVRTGDSNAGEALLLAEAERAAPSEPKIAARLLVGAALAAHVRPDAAAAIALAERARSLAGNGGDRVELEAVSALVEVRTAAGSPPDEEDFSLVARAAELLEDSGVRAGSEELHWIAYCVALHEHDVAARRLSTIGLADARAAGDVWLLCWAMCARAAIEQVTGRVDVARTWASEAVTLAEEVGEAMRLSEAYGLLAEAEAARGCLDDCEQAVAYKEVHWDVQSEFYRALWIGSACLASGKFEESVTYLETAARYMREGVGRAWYHLIPLELAEAYVAVRRTKDAEAIVRPVAGEIERSRLVRPLAKLSRVQALLAAEGKIDAAFAATLSLLEQVPHQLEQARTELCWGERLRSAGRSQDAVVHFEHALTRFDALAAVGWAERARRALEAASGISRPAQPRRTEALTPQELRVARYAAGGMRDREIAVMLYLSPRTVESYLHNAYTKLDISNRTQLAGVLAADGVRAAETVEQSP